MKKAQWTVFLFLLFMAFAMTLKDESGATKPEESSRSPLGTSNSSSKKSLFNRYIPNLGVFKKTQSLTSEFGIKTKKKLISGISSGSGPTQLGISKEKDMPKLGPAAFVYLQNRNEIAVLDNENNRINFYPIDPKEQSYSRKYPKNRQALGLSLDSEGQVTLLSRQYNPESGSTYPYYEIWKLSENQMQNPWTQKGTFSFSDRATHGAAQSLVMQSFGDGLLFKGLSENEFHFLKEGAQQTLKLPGFPLKNGNYLRTSVSDESSDVKNIQLEEINSMGVVNTLQTQEDITRLTGYRVLNNGLVALDLEADLELKLPRQVVLIDPKDASVKARTNMRRKENVIVEQDLFFHQSKVFQLAETATTQQGGKASFDVLQTDLGEQ
ncbi:MAG: hypothetical protein R3A80_08295 [Bdellovibrionota bacterium]